MFWFQVVTSLSTAVELSEHFGNVPFIASDRPGPAQPRPALAVTGYETRPVIGRADRGRLNMADLGKMTAQFTQTNLIYYSLKCLTIAINHL